MNASEEIREIAAVVEDYATHVGATDFVGFAGVMHSKIPRDGYRGMRSLTEITNAAFQALLRKQRTGDVKSPANFVLRVFGDLVTGKDVVRNDPPPSNGNAGGSGLADDMMLVEGRPQVYFDRVRAIEQWRRDRNRKAKDPTPPYWALYGFDSPEDYERSKSKPLRSPAFAEPPRTEPKVTREFEMPTMSDAIEGSHALQRNHEANETYAEDVDG
jgi:hypothetical protein